ncbi:MAG TPA: GNAT family N-acetyltransferase [Chitinophagaceae bacterium]|nr:GNAT family N-acetyltransferase [Chitinophagaceae bacterium]
MNNFKELDTGRLLVRQFDKTDQEAFIRFMTEPLITSNLAFDNSLKSEEGAVAILNQTVESYNSERPLLAFVVTEKISGAFMGACGINFLEPNKAEVFYAFFPEYWGNGFATEVLSKLKDHLVKDHVVKEIHAFITQHNIASMKVAEKCGFRKRGLVTKEGFSSEVFDYVLTM